MDTGDCQIYNEMAKKQTIEEQQYGLNTYLSYTGSDQSLHCEPSFGIIDNSTRAERMLGSHYVSSCAPTLNLLAGSIFIWEHKVPRNIVVHQYLNEAAMALSAMHLCYLRPPRTTEYAVAARKHFCRATEMFNSSVKELNYSNCVAVFGFSLIVAMFQFRVSTDTTVARRLYREMNDNITYAVAGLDVITALRGAWQLTPKLGPYMTHRSVGKYILGHGRDYDEHLLSSVAHYTTYDGDVESMLQKLNTLNQKSHQPENEKQECSLALSALSYFYAFMSRKMTIWLHIVWWPASVTEDFLQLLRNQNQISLLIYCHWLVAIKGAPRKWFLEGWAEQTFDSVKELLFEQWKDELQWAIQRLHGFEYSSVN